MRIKETQKEITDIYQELSYEELTNVLNEWLNPDEESGVYVVQWEWKAHHQGNFS